ncbi:MAG: dephospho-CoA kinase [Microcoleaceae cyanobacterium]
MRLIGLTGGIATGKTAVSTYLSQRYSLPIWDADVYAREAVQSDSPVLNAMVNRYGREILNPDQTLNRTQLGSVIFSDPTEREWVEAQIHPVVRDRFQQNIAALHTQLYTPFQVGLNPKPIAILAIPLLFEAQMTDLVTEIWVVSCSPSQQRQQLLQRDGDRLTPEQAQARIESQMSLAEKCQRADLVLNNTSTLEALYHQIDHAMAMITQAD